MSYIGKVTIDGGSSVLVGSTLFGVCDNLATATNKVINDPNNVSLGSNFDLALHGVTIHIKFTNGNTLTENVTLQVGGTASTPVEGNFVCAAGAVVAFTYEQTANGNHWLVNTSHGLLGSAAYTDTSAYATAAQGTKADNAMPKSGGQFTGPVTLSSDITSTSDALALATKNYVDSKTAGLSGLTGAMHFRGKINGTTLPDSTTSFNTYDSGDVILLGDHQEYVYTKGANAAASEWILLGDEGSYALKSNTDTITEVANFTTNTLPTLTPVQTTASNVSVTNGSAASLTTNNVNIPNVTAAGSATTASVTAGILNITVGAAPTIAETPITVKEVNVFTANTPTAVTATPVTFDAVSNWSAGSQAVLNTNDTTVVVPGTV